MLNFFFELGMLKRIRHEGARLAGVEVPDSVAEHSQRAAIIAYFLADAEGGNPFRCAMMALIHDVAECRVGDQHKVAARYVDIDPGEQAAFAEQILHFPARAQEEWRGMMTEFHERSTKDGVIGKDADWVEMAMTAREYVDRGYKGMEDWIRNVEKAVETATAQRWVKELWTADPNAWWQGLKKLPS